MAAPISVVKSVLFSDAQCSSFPFVDSKSWRKSSSPRTVKWRGSRHVRNVNSHDWLTFPFGCNRKSSRVDCIRTRSEVSQFVTVGDQSSSAGTCTHSEVFEGVGGSDGPVTICEARTLLPAISLDAAIVALQSAVYELETSTPISASGTLRIQVPLPPGLKALQWLQSQPQNLSLLPRSYFCPREAREVSSEGVAIGNGNAGQFYKLDVTGVGGVAGLGAAVLFNGSNEFSFKDWKAIRRFLSSKHPIIRAYGAMRFDPKAEPSDEWRSFGSFYFFIPQIELCESAGCSLLAVTLAWDKALEWPFKKALQKALGAMNAVSTRICPESERPLSRILQREHEPNENAWHDAVNETVNSLSNVGAENPNSLEQGSHDPAFFKVVMARRTKLEMSDRLDPISLLACLQDKDPSAYQFAIQVPDGSAFIGCSPERLFARDGLLLASEAVAGTRARGSSGLQDQQLGTELMESAKDNYEFDIVRENVKRQMEKVCVRVTTEISKSLLKQAKVQHLYARFNGELYDEAAEFDIMASVHPTPAVCGHPQAIAREAISTTEAFDRGLYAGPIGWFGGNGAEFAVGIRSSLIQPSMSKETQNGSARLPTSHVSSKDFDFGDDISCPKRLRNNLSSEPVLFNIGQEKKEGTRMFVYAGVGIVKGSTPDSEWRELNLKTSPFEILLEPRQPLEKIVNINALWATLIVEECCRLGITYFCIAPGSRSSALTAAAAANPQVTCVSCTDERSMAFHAVGYGRGANKAAAVITSSGTAVSNLFPAVVEASQDFVPLVILTADRPAELFDTGANQAIDQGKPFGGYVRYHANLPAADDAIPAKVVLTTIDAAVNMATIAPSGPVHINCAFREPLAGTAAWDVKCLKGLERWAATSAPYTQYIDCNPRFRGGLNPNLLKELEGVARLVDDAQKGLLIVGGLSAAEETWAVALLAQHLGWPVIPDVVSGLRFGEALRTEGVQHKKVNIIHNFDQTLLSQDVARFSKPSIILQIGSRLTSKRLSQFLQDSNVGSYLLVEDHSSRHDPSHIVTHRIQCSTVDFASTMIKITVSKPPTTFCSQLRLLSEGVSREINLKLQAESSLTEPFVGHYVVSCLPLGCALFLGNSMPIRDVDMYAHGAINLLGISQSEDRWDKALPQIGARVAANRGASGIDGVISTAIGFAVGSRQRVTLLLGDLSFLHDTNGLALLSERTGLPPVTVVVLNNHGGGIFSLLPVAKVIPKDAFTALFSTPQTVNLKKLCEAHQIGHMLIKTKSELKVALRAVQRSPFNWVIEVESKMEDNADFHRFLSSSIGKAVSRAFKMLSRVPFRLGTESDRGLRIREATYDHHSYPLVAPPTTVTGSPSRESLKRGFLLTIRLMDESSGIGEISPLDGLHKETLLDVEEQLRVIVWKMKDRQLLATLPLLDGSFSKWLADEVGIRAETLFPSVRMGVEMAVLGALAASQGCSLSELLSGVEYSRTSEERLTKSSSDNSNAIVCVCGLLDSEGSPEEAADAAEQLVSEGFCTLKLKVGRRPSPLEDAAVVNLIRKRVGPAIGLRADANRKWSYEQAVDFAKAIRDSGLQYLEEPLKNPLDIGKFCEETGLPVALDESLDEGLGNLEERFQTYASQGVVAAVIKPGVVGGFEKSWQIVHWAHMQGMMVVISSAFESSVSLAAYAQFSSYVDMYTKEATYRSPRKAKRSSEERTGMVAHGLGTFKWLSHNSLQFKKSTKNSIGLSNLDSASYLRRLCLNAEDFTPKSAKRQTNFREHYVDVRNSSGLFSFHVIESIPDSFKVCNKFPTIVFLHGFMGTAKEWVPIMDALSLDFRSISVDLLGHGQTTLQETEMREPGFSRQEHNTQTQRTHIRETQGDWSTEVLATALSELLENMDMRQVVLVGYSMGARIALYMTLRHTKHISAAVIVSGSPGISNSLAQKARAIQDDALTTSLRENGLQPFLHAWYRQPLWKSLQSHPDFDLIKSERLEQGDSYQLAKALASFSSGRQPSLWNELAHSKLPLLLVVGKLDTKFVSIAHKMISACEVAKTIVKNGNSMQSDAQSGVLPDLVEVEDCGHAVHIESPLKLVKAIRDFIKKRAC